MKDKKPILIVLGEPNSVFIEILSKVLNKVSIKKNIKYPIILIGSKKLLLSQLRILKSKLNFIILDRENCDYKKLKNKIYLIDVNYNFTKAFETISSRSKKYISKCFEEGMHLLDSILPLRYIFLLSKLWELQCFPSFFLALDYVLLVQIMKKVIFHMKKMPF